MAYGKGRATSYSDFYKGKDRTPENRETEEDEDKTPGRFSKTPAPRRSKLPLRSMPDRRKAVLQRKLAALRKGK